MLWGDKNNVLEPRLPVAYNSWIIMSPKKRRKFVRTHYYKEVFVDFTFEKIAKTIRKIPFAKYFLKIFYDYQKPFIGYEETHRSKTLSQESFGGVKVLLKSDTEVQRLMVSFFSVFDFLAQVTQKI